MKLKSILIWWVTVLLIGTGLFWTYHNGFITDIWTKDVTYLTSLISIIFVYGLINLGVVAWQLTRMHIPDRMTKAYRISHFTTVTKLLKRVWFLSEIEMGLAIVGTGIGIILLLGVNSDINVADTTALQSLLTHLWGTLGIAFYPNAVGLISSLILKLMAYFIAEDLNLDEE